MRQWSCINPWLDAGIAKECARFVFGLWQLLQNLYVAGFVAGHGFIISLCGSANGTQKEHMDLAEAYVKVFVGHNSRPVREATGVESRQYFYMIRGATYLATYPVKTY